MITVEPVSQISEQAACLLRRGGSRSTWNNIREEIHNGYAQLYRVTNDSYFVLRIMGNDLFVLALAGKQVHVLTTLLIQIARRNHLSGIRFRTVKKGLPRMLRRYDVEKLGDYYRIPVHENYH